jgi:tetratricopeptide (TPR) repeat protein
MGVVAATLRELADAPAEAQPGAQRTPVALRPPIATEPAIAPQWSRPATAGPTPQQLRSEGFRRGLVAATFLVLLLGAGFVFFLLPRWVERGAEAGAPAVPAAAPVAAAPAPVEPGTDLEGLAEAKREFDELRPTVVQRLEELEARAAGVWGGETFARGKRTLSEADAAYGRREHEAALERLRAADADLAATRKLAAEQLAAALSAGASALGQGDAATARDRFGRALQIDPANAVAKRGLERAGTLDEVTTLLAEARAAAERGDRAAAEAAYRKALALDRDARAAREGLARLQSEAGNAAFATAMSQGLEALARGDYAAAREAFERAGKIRPGAPEVADGLAQVERALGDRALAAHVGAAQQAERDERWAEALAEYRKALAIDRNLALAKQGVERAEPRAMLDAELAAYLERPERLFSPDVRAAARTAIARARGLGEPGPALSRQIAAAETLITAAETPQRVSLTSDNQTDVTVYRVGRIGTFERKDLELLPGRYTVVGMRAGYRDVRREFTLLPGREAPTVAIRCEEPI